MIRFTKNGSKGLVVSKTLTNSVVMIWGNNNPVEIKKYRNEYISTISERIPTTNVETFSDELFSYIRKYGVNSDALKFIKIWTNFTVDQIAILADKVVEVITSVKSSKQKEEVSSNDYPVLTLLDGSKVVVLDKSKQANCIHIVDGKQEKKVINRSYLYYRLRDKNIDISTNVKENIQVI